MSDTQAPSYTSIVRYKGVCRNCGTKLKRPIYAEADNGTHGIYVRCECDQINRCFR